MADPRSNAFRRVAIYFGVSGPLQGEISEPGEQLEGRLGAIYGIVRWTLWAVLVVIAVTLDDPFWHGIVAAVGGGLLLGCVLRIYTAWALRRQRPINAIERRAPEPGGHAR
jgi:hypothetical protein